MESFIGTIMPVAWGFTPRGWAQCNGQLMSISQNSALFALLGTTYGGDGVSTFGLPDLRGRVALHQGTGAGVDPIAMGQKSGTNNTTVIATGNVAVTLTAANLPAHTHTASFTPGTTTPIAATAHVSTADGTAAKATEGMYLGGMKGAGLGAAPSAYVAAGPTVGLNAATITATGGVTSGTVSVDSTGSGQTLAAPVSVNGQASVMQPYLGVNFLICLEGIFPTRE